MQQPHTPLLPLCNTVTRVRPASEELPDPLSVINYVTMSMPLLAPFIPIYKVRQRQCHARRGAETVLQRSSYLDARLMACQHGCVQLT